MTVEENKRIIREAIETESVHDFDRTFETIDDECVAYMVGAEPIVGTAQARSILDALVAARGGPAQRTTREGAAG